MTKDIAWIVLKVQENEIVSTDRFQNSQRLISNLEVCFYFQPMTWLVLKLLLIVIKYVVIDINLFGSADKLKWLSQTVFYFLVGVADLWACSQMKEAWAATSLKRRGIRSTFFVLILKLVSVVL